MCRIERFTIVDSSGRRQPRSHLRCCERGTPITPCNNTIFVDIGHQSIPKPTHHFHPPPPPPPPPPQFDIIEHRRRRSKRKEFTNRLRLVFDFHIPFTSRNKNTTRPKSPKRESIFVRRRQRHQEPEQLRPHQPFPQPQPQYIPPQGPPIVQVPFQPPTVHVPRPPEPEIMYPRGQQPTYTPISEILRRDEENMSPPIAGNRQHSRHRRHRSYEEDNRIQREREQRQHEERVANDRARAQREADIRRRNEEREVERERLREERRERQRREQEQAIADEQQRLARLRRQRIPRQARHQTALHQDVGGRGSLDERGERFINDAIQADRQWEADQNRPPTGWNRRRNVGNGRRVRDAVAIGERRVDEYDRRRIGNRWF